MQEQNQELRKCLRRLKRVFSYAEDMLDEFECKRQRKQVVKAHGTTKDKVSHFLSTSNPLVFRYKMAQQIKDISKSLDKLQQIGISLVFNQSMLIDVLCIRET